MSVVAPFDVVGTNHELKKTVTTALMNNVIFFKPFKSAVKRFGVEIERFGKIFLGGTDKTCLLVGVKSKPEEDAQSHGLERFFEQIIAFIEVESHKDSLHSKYCKSGRSALF